MLSETSRRRIEQLMSAYPHRRTALIPALHIAQEEFGYIPNEAVEELAAMFGLSSADVEGVVTFYSMFFRKPTGKYLLQVCTNISCLLCGGEDVLNRLKNKLDVGVGETTADNQFTLLEVECIGACEMAPVMQVNFDYHGNLTKEKIDNLLEELKRH